MSQGSPAERRGTEEPEDKHDSPPLVKSTSYWLDDGNVILQAENTQYRVHRSLLSRHSDVFKDMFSLPQPTTDPGPTSEECPLIFLSDKATDIEHVLSVMYDNIRVYDVRGKMSVDFLGAILRLGKKYDIDYLCEEGMKRLRLDFPTTLEQWNECLGQYNQIKSGTVGSMEMVLGIIDLAHELSIPRCLPIAYFLLVTSYRLECILGLKSSVDGGGLDRGDLLTLCVLGRDRLIHAYHAILEDWIDKKLFMPSNGCCSRPTCATRKIMFLRRLELFQIEDDPVTEGDTPGTLAFLDPWEGEFLQDLGLCKSCLASNKLAYEDACEQLWSQIPGFFGLQPWDELKDFDM